MDDLFIKLDKLYDDYDNIVVMGHSYPDLDCYGSSLGIYKKSSVDELKDIPGMDSRSAQSVFDFFHKKE